MGRLPRMAVGMIVLALAVTACSNSNNGTSGGSSSGGGGSTGGAGATSATVTVQNFAFDPSSLNMAAGSVTITVTNKDTREHTFTLDDGSSTTDLPPGKTETITLDVSKTVGWHCSIHPSMTGTLNVA